MATWNEISSFIKTKFTIQEDSGNCLKISLQTVDLKTQAPTRTQTLFVFRNISNTCGEWVQVVSPIGIIPLDKTEIALTKINNLTFGGLIKIDDKHYLRESLLLSAISPQEILQVINNIVSFADALEDDLCGGDIN